MTIKLEKNIPVPKKQQGCKYLNGISIGDIEIGDSFFIDNTSSYDAICRTIRAQFCRHFGVGALAVRAEGNGLRFWRVK